MNHEELKELKELKELTDILLKKKLELIENRFEVYVLKRKKNEV